MHHLAADNTWHCMVRQRHDRPFDAISASYRPPPQHITAGSIGYHGELPT